MLAAVVAAEQVRLLQANGVDEFHFYTLNRPDLVYAIAHILGVRPAPRPQRARIDERQRRKATLSASPACGEQLPSTTPPSSATAS